MSVRFDQDAYRRLVLGLWPSDPLPPEPTSAGEILAAVDAAVEGRCAGPGCSAPLTADSPSGWWCSPDCQAAYHRQGTTRPHEVRGSTRVAPDPARWRPDLVDDFDDSGWTLLDRTHHDDTGLTYSVLTDLPRDMAFLRVDDGHRFVGLEVPWAELEESGPSGPFRRLERELTDSRRLDPEPGPSEPAAIMRVGDRVYFEPDRPTLIAWLCANGLVPEDVPAGQTVTIDGDTLILDCFTRDTEGNLRIDEARENFLAQPVSVPLVQPPPEPRSDLLRRMGEAFDREVLGREGERAVLSGWPDPRAADTVFSVPNQPVEVAGAVFWLPDPPADPEHPTAAELAGGIDLTPYLAPSGARVTGTWVDEVPERSVNERFRRAGEQVEFGAVVAGPFAETYRRAAQEESDQQRLRAACRRPEMYQRALEAARERGWSTAQMAAAVATGRYTEEGWLDDPAG